MTKTDDAERLPTRVAALAVLVDVRGQAALPDLLAAVDHQDREYRKAALASRREAPAPRPSGNGRPRPTRWMPERRAEIVLMLGRQGDKASAAYIRGALAAKEPVVVMAAAESLAHMEGRRGERGSPGAAQAILRRPGAGRSATSCCGRRTRRARADRGGAGHALAVGEGRRHPRDRRQVGQALRGPRVRADVGLEPRGPHRRHRRAGGSGRRRRPAGAAPAARDDERCRPDRRRAERLSWRRRAR